MPYRSTNDFQDRIAAAVAQSTAPAMREALAVSFLRREPRSRRTARTISYEPTKRVAVLADASHASDGLCRLLKRMGYTALLLPNQSMSDAWHKTFERFAQLCFVDYDSYAKRCDPIEFCMHLRSKHPGLPTILVSETFSKNDLSMARASLCDASMVWTSDPEILTEVLSGAQSNNLCRRLLQEMQQE